MKVIGFLLLIGGFLVAAYSTALDTDATAWVLFVPAALIGIAGVGVVKRDARGEARSESVLSANRNELSASLGSIVKNLDDIVSRKDSIGIEALRDEIDRLLRTDLRRFADARESMIHLYGLQTYADIMSEFASGERYINRVWSASADGYGDEASAYLDRARAQFQHASGQLKAAASS
jgi:hypothetical protein